MEVVYQSKTVHNQMRRCSLLVQIFRMIDCFEVWLSICLMNIRIIRIAILIVMASSSALAQFGNEWINYNQSYYKIPITKTGIYRLTQSDLSLAGLPVNSIDPRRIQIFRRGVEQSINFHYNEVPANSQFDSGEYLEFYGEKNDGATDADLYKNPAHHPHLYYNLYSDTAAYFLTWNILPVQGKRMAVLNPVVNVNNYLPEGGFSNTVFNIYPDQYFQGTTYIGAISNSFFDEGEGWTGAFFCNGASGCTGQKDLPVQLLNAATLLSPPQLELLLVGRAELTHTVEVYVGKDASSLRLITATTFQKFKNAKINATLQWTDVAADGTMMVRIKLLASTKSDFISASYLKIDYPRNFNFNALTSQTLELLPNGINESYIEIQNAATGLLLFDITDITSASILGTYPANSNLAAVVTGTSSSRKLYAASTFSTPSIKKISFRQITPSSHNYLIISNLILHKPALGVNDPVKEYASYRASAIGGSFDTLTVNVDQLYNQFNYGETSSRAIYQFLKFMSNGGNPKYVFLIGKGLELNFAYDRKRVFLPTDLKDLVPTAGFPGADLNYTAGLEGASIYEPGIPVGRIAATSSLDVVNYLNKVKETEALPFDALWRKNILHLSGGIAVGEPETFKYYVDGFKSIAQDIYYGSQVSTKSKRILSPETIPIAEQVNSGLNLITFFGHSATTILDFDIGFVTDASLGYSNKGKYPAFIINGCNVGRIFDNRTGTARSFGEDWILAKDLGARAFIANSTFGESAMLRFYTDEFYRKGMADSVGLTLGIGDIQKQVAHRIFSFSGTRTEGLAIMYQMVLMGDPAVKLFGAPKTDFAIQNSFLNKLSLDGTPITSATKTFGISFKIRNYGQARPDSIRVKIARTLPDNSIVEYDTIIHKVYYENDFVFVVPNSSAYSGQNNFKITIDSNNDFEELNEDNNIANYNLFIPGSATYNLVPYSFSIVNSTSVELIFQNTNQIPLSRDYQLELDTVPTFNSVFLKTKKIGTKVLGRIVMTLLSKDSTVYYWRTKLDQPQQGESADWFTTSFSYIAGSTPGWAQLKNAQISFDAFEGLNQSAVNGKLTYPDKISNVFVHTLGSANSISYTNTSFKVNNEELNLQATNRPCRLNTINVVAFDKNTGSTYAGINFTDNRACGRQPRVINSFTQSEVEDVSNGLATVITNIAVNDSVVIFNIGNAGVQALSNTLLTKLGEVGISASQLSNFQAGEPFIVFGKKGATPGSAKVIRALTAPINQQELVASETITTRAAIGNLTSTIIGPAKSWNYLKNNIKSIEASDDYTLNIIGIKNDNSETILQSTQNSFVNLAFIDALIYPNIKIELITNDITNLTPVDLKNWVVYYSPEPEGIVLYRGDANPVSLQEGDSLRTKYSFINLTGYSYSNNALNAEHRIINHETSNLISKPIQISAPLPKDSVLINWKTETIGYTGINRISVSVNTKQIPEQYFFNNSIESDSYLNVLPDTQAPVLDITVDGRYLTNGDYVSHNPEVLIKLIDENIFRFKTDTIGVQILITNIDTEEVSQINFTNPDLTWHPATAETVFKILFIKELQAGNYELSVQAADVSGNKSGETPYKVSFVVTDDVSVRIGEPFPNPSASIFSFPIKFSGNELPESFSLKIFAADGHLINHYHLNDVSGFFIGSNELKWNANENPSSSISTIYFFRMEIKVGGKVHSKSGRLLLAR